MQDLEAYRLALELSPSPLLLVDSSGTVLLANQPAHRLFGYPDGVLVGQPVEHLVPEAVRDRHVTLREAYHAAPRRQQMGTGRDLFGIRKDGSAIPIEVGLEPIESLPTPAVLTSVLDISERKHLETKTRLAIDAAATAMVMVDSRGIIVLTNEGAHELFGYEASELIGRPVETLVPTRHRERHPQFVAAYLAAQERRPMGRGQELFGLRKDGSEVPVEIGLTPIRAHDGNFVMSTIHDVTHRKAHEAEILAKNEELARLNAELTSFAYSTSHDLKAPLASMQGLLRFAEEDLGSGDTQSAAEVIRNAHDLAERLAARIEQVLSIVRATAVEEPAEAIDLGPLVQEIWGDLCGTFGSHTIQFTYDGKHTPPFNCPLRPLRAVLENLLSNALKYTDRAKPESAVTVRTRDRRMGVEIIVEDNGIGIPEEHQGDVFGMFTRFADDETPGTGLGLAIVQRHVLALGGHIALTSSPEGTQFTVTLPREEASKP